jgi:hypothetical protein
MTDKREQILARLLEVVENLSGVVHARRNKDEIPEHQRPAVLIFDADEQALEERDAHRAGAPQLVTMTPEILLLLGGTPESVGSDLNAFRAKLLKAVLTDDTLKSIIGADGRNGHIRYVGCATSLGHGRMMEAEMGVSIAFTYVLKPAEL